jgi:hypothetical protein
MGQGKKSAWLLLQTREQIKAQKKIMKRCRSLIEKVQGWLDFDAAVASPYVSHVGTLVRSCTRFKPCPKQERYPNIGTAVAEIIREN